MPTITQSQYDTARQVVRNLHIRVNLLNFDYQTISSFEGNLIEGSLTSDSNSNMRNSCTLSLVVTDSSFNITAEGKIWLDRLVQVFIGVDDVKTGEVAWTNKGIYLINQPSYQYDAATNTVTFEGVDLMGLMTGFRGGYLLNSYLVPQGENVREVILAILNENGFGKYVVSECMNIDGSIQPVPYDIQKDAGSTWWDLLDELLNILPNYQMYFDTDGVFHYETIPYKKNETIQINDSIWKDNVISENVQYDFESVKNSVKVLGRAHTISNYPTTQALSGSTLVLTIPSMQSLGNTTMIGFTPPVEVDVGAIQIDVNNTGGKPLVDSKGAAMQKLSKGVYYVAQYNETNSNWLYMGHVQAEGYWEDDDVDSPFYVGNPAGKIEIVLYGEEYDNIVTDELAEQRAKWEIYQRCRLNDSISITCIPVYWAEVNWMVSYTPLGQNKVQQYLIKSITTDLKPDGTQTLNLVKYYPYYE